MLEQGYSLTGVTESDAAANPGLGPSLMFGAGVSRITGPGSRMILGEAVARIGSQNRRKTMMVELLNRRS